jgi:hypothetical protein
MNGLNIIKIKSIETYLDTCIRKYIRNILALNSLVIMVCLAHKIVSMSFFFQIMLKEKYNLEMFTLCLNAYRDLSSIKK